jgi:hypothetical protein
VSAAKTKGVPTTESGRNESRRETLKRFGRYAAAAPTVMMLLKPRSADAHHKPWHTGGGGGGYWED